MLANQKQTIRVEPDRLVFPREMRLFGTVNGRSELNFNELFSPMSVQQINNGPCPVSITASDPSTVKLSLPPGEAEFKKANLTGPICEVTKKSNGNSYSYTVKN